MAHPKYNTAEYVAARREITRLQQAGMTLTCVQPVCLYRSREIPPSWPADVAHDETGTVILGPAHSRCNRSDGGRRSNGNRGKRQQRRRPRPYRKWIL